MRFPELDLSQMLSYFGKKVAWSEVLGNMNDIFRKFLRKYEYTCVSIHNILLQESSCSDAHIRRKGEHMFVVQIKLPILLTIWIYVVVDERSSNGELPHLGLSRSKDRI